MKTTQKSFMRVYISRQYFLQIDIIMIWNLAICRCIGWNIIALSAEVNSFFLHSRKLMQMHRIEKSDILYKLNMAMNLWTFIIFRFGSCLCMLVGIYYQRARVSPAFYIAIIGCLIVMSGINPVLFYRLIKSDLLTKSSIKRTFSSTQSHHQNNNQIHNKVE